LAQVSPSTSELWPLIGLYLARTRSRNVVSRLCDRRARAQHQSFACRRAASRHSGPRAMAVYQLSRHDGVSDHRRVVVPDEFELMTDGLFGSIFPRNSLCFSRDPHTPATLGLISGCRAGTHRGDHVTCTSP